MTESLDVKLNGGTMWLRVSCGEVVSQQKWSETRVSSHGGSLSADGRHVSAPSISSVVTEKHEFWIREADGKEVAIEFSDGSFQAREGHKIWVAWGGKKGRESGSYLFANNFVTGKITEVKDEWMTWLYKVGLIKKPLLYSILTKWVSILFGIIVGVVFPPNIFDSHNSQIAHFYEVLNSGITGVLFSDFDAFHNVVVGFNGLLLSSIDSFCNGISRIRSAGDFFALFLVFGCSYLAGWFPAWCVTNLVGYLFFLQWRDKVLVKSVKNKILNACIEAANKANVTS